MIQTNLIEEITLHFLEAVVCETMTIENFENLTSVRNSTS